MGKLVSKFVFLPPNKLTIPEQEDISLTTKNNSKIQVKIIERGAIYTIIVSHGNAEDVSSVKYWAENILLPKVNVNLILYEYTGYGSNEEGLNPSESFIYNDIEAVYNYAIFQRGIKQENIILYGRSLGSGPSCYLAEKYKVGGLILNCGFMSILRVIFKFRFTMPFDMFPNIDRMKKIECPVLIIHSIKDEIVPFYHGKELYKAAKFPFEPLFLDGTTHNNIDKIYPQVFSHINAFLRSIDPNYSILTELVID